MTLTTPLNAASAYGSMAQLANRAQEGQGAGMGTTTGVPDFGVMLRDEITSMVDQGNKSEALQANMMAGKADLVDVVSAVSETELALETMVSIRDRVITAYEEIMRMPI